MEVKVKLMKNKGKIYDLGFSNLEINPILKSNSNYNNKYIQNQFQENSFHNNVLKETGNQIMK
jgi:hypothetical protein